MPDALQSLTTASNEAEAGLICSRLLAEAGIHAVCQSNIGGPEWGASGSRTVFVDAKDLARALEVLATDTPPFSDEELARLSEEAGRETKGT